MKQHTRRLRITQTIAAAAFALTASFAASSAHAITSMGNNVSTSTMSVTYTAVSSSLGRLTFNGNTVGYKTPGATTTTNFSAFGTFTANVYFNLATGKLLGEQSGTSLLVTGWINGKQETLYQASKVYNFSAKLGGTGSTFDILWNKDGGLFSNSANAPFIGTTISSSTTLMNGAKSAAAFTTTKTSYANAMPIYSAGSPGTVLFQNTGSSGNANTFLTPTPTAVAGGLASLGIAAVERRRRHRRAAQATA